MADAGRSGEQNGKPGDQYIKTDRQDYCNCRTGLYASQGNGTS